LEGPPSAIGRDTVTALQSGIVYGFVGQVEGIVARMKRELGSESRVVATGGLAGVAAGHTNVIDSVEEDLVLHGLRLYSLAAMPQAASVAR
ncbi:MAG: type III pantothenate kinase, partial [Candidatus Eremiobacteraeota bacterium]|nr:type III pantothenate kinase [Candidatus Eremiobacteraeota bacterium]